MQTHKIGVFFSSAQFILFIYCCNRHCFEVGRRWHWTERTDWEKTIKVTLITFSLVFSNSL